MHPKIDVLLATYRGATYLDSFLESLFRQTCPRFHLVVRDDLSDDATPAILERWRRFHPHQITLLPARERLGVIGNFSELMQTSRAHYFMLADQDDVWHSEKIELSLDAATRLERTVTPDVPVLVHTDLEVVDEHLSPVDPSFWHYTGINPNKLSLERLLVQNGVTGCTICGNRALAVRATPIPDQAVMHDAWLALIAAAYGKLEHIDRVTLSYRQHGSNTLGAQRYGWKGILRKGVSWIFNPPQHNPYAAQARCFSQKHHAHLPAHQQRILDAYTSLTHHSYIAQRIALLRYGFLKQGFWRNCAHLLKKI